MKKKQLLSLSRIFSKGKLTGWAHIDPSVFKHTMYTLNGEKIAFGQSTEGLERLPRLLNDKILVGDLIPSTSWGSSLANLLTPKAWNALRMPVIERNNGVCQFCGDYVGKSLEIHEVWRYTEPPSQDYLDSLGEREVYFGTQRLTGFVGVCKSCHACFHLGLANVQGRLEQVMYRLSMINGWTSDEANEYLNTVMSRHEWLSEIYWAIDLSWLKDQVGEGLLVSSTWKRMEDGSPVLLRDSSYGQSVSVITGCPWRRTTEKEWSYLENNVSLS